MESYELFNEKVFKFDDDHIQVDLQYIETLAPSDAVRLQTLLVCVTIRCISSSYTDILFTLSLPLWMGLITQDSS